MQATLFGMNDRDPDPRRAGLSSHILPTAGTMLGICTTLIGLVKVVEGRTGPSHVDDYGRLLAIVFLLSALSSYASIRSAGRDRASRVFERAADACFIVGLIGLCGLSFFFAYELV